MFDKMFDSTILCAIIAGIWICLSVIEFIGLGTHIDSTDPQSVAKQGIMFTFASVITTFWIIMAFEPSFPKIHKRVVILFCVLQIVYFLMYFISGGWINNDSKISFTDTNEWGKAKLSLSILGIIFLSYTFFLAIVDKNTWVQKITLTAVLPPKIEPSNGKK
jgi:hypothetical protein